MECPNCKHEMSEIKPGVSYSNGGKPYDTMKYRCMHCDTWADVETPQEEPEQAS